MEYPDLTKPVPIPPLETELPDPTKGKPTKTWEWYNRTPQGRRYLRKQKERPITT